MLGRLKYTPAAEMIPFSKKYEPVTNFCRHNVTEKQATITRWRPPHTRPRHQSNGPFQPGMAARYLNHFSFHVGSAVVLDGISIQMVLDKSERVLLGYRADGGAAPKQRRGSGTAENGSRRITFDGSGQSHRLVERNRRNCGRPHLCVKPSEGPIVCLWPTQKPIRSPRCIFERTRYQALAMN